MNERIRTATGSTRVPSRAYRPLDTLTNHNGKNVFVKLKDGSEYMARLKNADYSMNLVLIEAREVTVTNKTVAILGEIYVRGSNLLLVSLEPEKVTFFQEAAGKARQEERQEQVGSEEE